MISVMDFYAVGDGVTNDAPAFIAAVAALPESGGTILVPDSKAYLLDSEIVTGTKKVAWRIGSTTIIAPPGAFAFRLQSNGSSLQGNGRWATIIKLRAPETGLVEPDVTVLLSGTSVDTASASGGSGFVTTPVVLVGESAGTNDLLAHDAALVATIDVGTVSELAVVESGSDYASPPSVSFLGGGAGAVMIESVQNCTVSDLTIDFSNIPNSTGVVHRGGWWADVRNLNAFYDVATGASSESATTLGIVIDSFRRGTCENGIPGPNGDYGGVFVCNYTNLMFGKRAVIGHTCNTATTLQFSTCDIKNSYIHATIGVTDVNPVAQGETGALYDLVNVDGLTLVGGDFEAAIRLFHFKGVCNNIRVLNTLAYATEGSNRGMAGTGCLFDFAKGNATLEPLRVGSGGQLGQAFQNTGWLRKHRFGAPYSGESWVMASNLKLTDSHMGRLDDPSASGVALDVVSGSWRFKIAYAGSGLVNVDEIAVIDATGMSIAGGGLRVAGKRVVGQQQPAIADANAATTVTKINAILEALRVHGLIASM